MSEAKAAIYEAQGFGGGMGMGRKPALCIVDFVNGFTDPAQFGGGNILPAVHRTRDLLAAMRQRGLPIPWAMDRDCVSCHHSSRCRT